MVINFMEIENGKRTNKSYDLPSFEVFKNILYRIVMETSNTRLQFLKNFNFNSNIITNILLQIYNSNKKYSLKSLAEEIRKNIKYIKSTSIYQKNFWIDRGWSEEDTINRVRVLQSNNGFKFSKKLKDNPNCRVTSTQLKWWLNKGYTKEEAERLLSNRQKTFSKKICIEKYGEINGLKVFKKRQVQWRKSIDSKYHKHTQDQWRIKGAYVSKTSLDLFTPFYEKYKNIYTCYLGLGKNEKEYFIWNKKLRRIFSYDFTIKELGLIFEYQGEHVHPNPEWPKEKWDNWKSAFSKQSADEVYNLYKQKILTAEQSGFKVIQIWESNSLIENQKIIDDEIAISQSLHK